MDARKITEPTPYQNYIFTLVELLQDLMFLQEYEILIDFEDKESDARATMFTNQEYLWAKLELFPCMEKDFVDGDFANIAGTIIHEFCHILTDPLYKVAYRGANVYTEPYLESIREQSTQRVARIILALLPEELLTP